MARGQASAELPPRMQLRQKTTESQKHPGKVTDYDWKDDPNSTVTVGEKVAERAQKKTEKEKVEKTRQIGQKKLAAIEDRLRREDVDREMSANHPPIAVTPKATGAQPKTAQRLKQPASKPTNAIEQNAAPRPVASTTVSKPTASPKTAGTEVVVEERRSRRSTTASQTKQSELNHAGTIMDDSGESDAFVAPDEDDEDDENKDSESEDGGEKKRGNVKTPSTTRKADDVRDWEATSKKVKLPSGRSAVNASRSTIDAVGTPTPKPKALKRRVSDHPDPNQDVPIIVSDHEQDAAPKAKKQKTNDTAATEGRKKQKKDKKKSGGGSLTANFEQKQGDDKAKILAHSTALDEESLVNVGASIVNDNEQDDNEFVDLVKKEPGDAHLSIIAITPGDHPRTAKEARGGTKKWLINVHIPVEARNAFKHGLSRLFKTCLALSNDPWAALTAKQVQECVDTEFGPNVYQVGPKGAWVGCANYRLGDYRHDFPETAAKLFLKFIREDNRDHFTGPEDIAEYANWVLAKDKGGTAPIHWKTWGGGTKKSGILRNFFIIDMLVHTYYLSLPDIEDPRTAPRPIGLILLSEQAMSREISLWTTGYRLATKQAPQFSKQNYGDISELRNLDPKKYGEGTFKQQNHKRGSFFLKTMLSWTDDKWEAYLADVKEAVEESRPAQHKTKAAQPETVEEDDEMIFASDPPVPDEDVPMADGDGDGTPDAFVAAHDSGDGGNGEEQQDHRGGDVNVMDAEIIEAVDAEDDVEGDEVEGDGGQFGEGSSTDGGIPVASEDDDDSSSSDSD